MALHDHSTFLKTFQNKNIVISLILYVCAPESFFPNKFHINIFEGTVIQNFKRNVKKSTFKEESTTD